MNDRRVLVIAGPNGAGKTTFARAFLPEEAHCPRFVNADLIAAGLSPFAPDAAAVRAGRLMLEEIDACIARGEAFAFETTLAGHGYLRRIAAWRAAGWRVTLFFLALPDPEWAIGRVVERVRQGGHHVPDDVVRRRFIAGRRNFEQHYRHAVGDWVLYDITGRRPNSAGMEGPTVNEEAIEQASNPDIAHSLAALRRAARMARELAVRTDTAIVVSRNGKLVRITAEELRREGIR